MVPVSVKFVQDYSSDGANANGPPLRFVQVLEPFALSSEI